MYAGIADMINCRVAQAIAEHLDAVDARLPSPRQRWYLHKTSEAFLTPGNADNSYRAWLIGRYAARTPDVEFDGTPAEADWENLFSHFRAEILARRNPQTPPVQAQPLCEMV